MLVRVLLPEFVLLITPLTRIFVPMMLERGILKESRMSPPCPDHPLFSFSLGTSCPSDLRGTNGWLGESVLVKIVWGIANPPSIVIVFLSTSNAVQGEVQSLAPSVSIGAINVT
jgi:hypothetical protein